MGIENKKLNNIINFFHLEKNKLIENKQNMNTPNNNAKNKTKMNGSCSTPYSASRNRKINFTKLKSKMTETRIRSSNSSISQRSKLRRNNILTRTKISDDYRRRTHSSEIANKKRNSTKNRFTMSGIYDEEIYHHHSIDSKDLKNPLFQSLQSMNNSPLINKHHKNEIYQFMDRIQTYKRKNDPISMATYINEFQKLINHINRLFLYKAKNNYSFEQTKRLKNLLRNKKGNSFNNLIKSIKKSQSTGNMLQNFVKKKIVGKLNGIINNLAYKEEDDNKNE
jgi:hypothetical protein